MRITFLLLALLSVSIIGCDGDHASSESTTPAASSESAAPAAASSTEAPTTELASMMSAVHQAVAERTASAQSLAGTEPALKAARDAQASARLRNVILENEDEFRMADSGSYSWSYNASAPTAKLNETSIFEGTYDSLADDKPADMVWIVVREMAVAGGTAELILVVDK